MHYDRDVHVHVHVKFGPSQLSCLGSSAGRALCLECGVSWVRIPPEAAHFSLEKCLPCFVLFFIRPCLLLSFFLLHLSLTCTFIPSSLLPYIPSSSPTFVRLFIRCMSMCYLVCAACSVSQVVCRKTTVVSGERVCYTHFLVQSACSLYMCVYTSCIPVHVHTLYIVYSLYRLHRKWRCD